MTDVPVQTAVADGVLTVTLSRPEVRNAMHAAAWEGLTEALQSAASVGARAAVLTGAGGAFCAGGDLKSMHTHPVPGIYGKSQRLILAQNAITQLYEVGIPVVAAVSGPAAGVGWSMALACDVIIAGEGAFFVAPFVERGVVPDGGLGWLLARSVGRHRALDIILRHQKVSAARGVELGFVAEVVADGDVLTRATAVAQELAAGPTETIGLVKRLVARGLELPFSSYLENERNASALNHLSGNPAEGVTAWRERRPPDFGGPDRGRQ